MLLSIFQMDASDPRSPLNIMSTVTKASRVKVENCLISLLSLFIILYCLSLKLEVACFDFVQQIII